MFFKKKQRFSIRKFTIGTCSVLLGTAFVASVDSAMADQVESTIVDVTATKTVPELTQKTEGTVSKETTVEPVPSVDSPVVEAEPATTAPSETTSVVNTEETSTRESSTVENSKETSTPKSEPKESVVATPATKEEVTIQETGEVVLAPKRNVEAVYKVTYTDTDTNEVVYSNNYSVLEKTSLPKSEHATINVSVRNEIGTNPALDGWKLAAHQAAVMELAVVERGGRQNLLNFNVVKAETSGSDRSYTGFRATESSTDSDINVEAVRKDNEVVITENYSVRDPESVKYKDSQAGRYTYANLEYKNNPDIKYILSIDEAKPESGDRPSLIYVTPIDANGMPLADSFVADVSKPGDSQPFSTIDAANPTITVTETGQITIAPVRNGDTNNIGITENLLAPARISVVYLNEAVLGAPTYTEQVTKYVEYKTNKPLLPDYVQSGWVGFNYTTEAFDIPGYKLVSANDNKSGIVTTNPTIVAGDTTYSRIVAPLAEGPMTIYRKVVYDNNTGHGTMTVYVSPKSANNPDDAATLPSAEEFFTNIDNYTTFDYKYYGGTHYTANVDAEADRRYKADSSKTLEEYKKEIMAEDSSFISTDRDAFYHAPVAEKTGSEFKKEGVTDYLYYDTVNTRPFEFVGNSTDRAAIYEPLFNSRTGITGIATLRNGWRQSDTVIYEYAKFEKVQAEYYVENTDTHLYPDPADYTKENPEPKLVKEDIAGEAYTDTPPKTLYDKDGIEYTLVVDEQGNPVLKDGSAPKDGTIEDGGQIIQYQYAAKKGGEVAAQYYIEGTTTRLYPEDNTDKTDTVVKEQDTPVGTKYEDTPPTTLKDDKGVVYELVKNPDGTPKIKEGSAPTTGTVTENKQVIQYEYAPKKGGEVEVHYIDTEGNVLKDSAPVQPADTPVGTSYDAESGDKKPNTIKTEDGKTYKLVVNKEDEDFTVGKVAKDGHLATSADGTQGTDEPTGQVGEEKKVVTYVYEEVKGDVVVLYRINDGKGTPLTGTATGYSDSTKDGTVIGNVSTSDTQDKDDDTARSEWEGAVFDTKATSTGTAYDTTDNKPTTITTTDGKIYKLVEDKVGGRETGTVSEGTARIVYYYELQKGSVDVTYVDTDGNPITFVKEDGTEVAGQQDVAKDQDSGTDYATNTDELRPETLKTKDGKTYKLVPKGADYPVGEVDENGHLTTSASVDGKVTDKQQTVTYVYEEVKGDVVVLYRDEDGNPITGTGDNGQQIGNLSNTETEEKQAIEGAAIDTAATSTGQAYDTTDKRPNTITTADGKVYELVPEKTSGSETGDIVEGTTKVTYVYRLKEVPPKTQYATITYYDVTDENDPNKINEETKKQLDTVDRKEGLPGEESDYSTETRIQNYLDKGWELVSDEVPAPIIFDDQDDADKEKPTQQYVVKLKHKITPVDPNTPNPPKPGEPINPNDPRSPVWPPEVADLVREKTRTIRYRYADKPGLDQEEVFEEVVQTVRFTRTVTVDHVTGKVTISDWQPEVSEAPAVNSPEKAGYTFDKNAPLETATIDKDGNISGINDQLILYTPQVYIPYIPQDPKNPLDPNDPHDPTIPETGEKIPEVPYDQTPEDPTDDPRLPDVPDYIPVDPNDPTKPLPKDPDGNHIPPTPTDPKKPTPVPYLPAGTVTVHYVDEKGNVLQDPTVDTEKSLVGTPYNTNENDKEIPKEIIGKDGKTYVLVGVDPKDKDKEIGTVKKGNIDVTYVYKLKEDTPPPTDTPQVYIPYIPQDPKNPLDPNDPHDPTIPETGEKIPEVPYDQTPEDPTDDPRLPDVPDYIPVDPNDPTKPLPKDPDGNYIPPTPTDPKQPTPVPYLPAGTVTVHYVDEKGNVLQDPTVDTEKSLVGTPYNTNENDKEIPKEITGKDGKTYILVGVDPKDKDKEIGTVKKGNIDVTYVYKLKEDTPPPTDTPQVYIPYIPQDPKNPLDPNDPHDPTIPETGEKIPEVPYDQTPEDPSDDPRLPDIDGYIPVDPNDPTKPLPKDPDGNYIPPTPTDPKQPTPVPYLPAGTVTVHYVDENGNVIQDPTVDTEKSPVGTPYNTNENDKEIPKEITGKDGKTYVLVGVDPKDKDKEIGTVEKGNIDVTYVYKLKEDTPPPTDTPQVYIPYIPQDPKNPLDPNDPHDPTIPETGEKIPEVPYDQTPEDPSDDPRLPDIDGYIPVDPNDPTKPLPKDPDGNYIPPTPTDPKQPTPVPYLPAGTVTVHYVDENGNVLQDPTVDTEKSPVGTPYNTNENDKEIPKEITGKDGKIYVLVGVDPKDKDKEIGTVEKGNIDVTYVYKLKEDTPPPTDTPQVYIPYIPQDPKNPLDPNDPHDPTIPETGEKIPEVPYDQTPEDPSDDPRLPDIDGYIPVDPNDPTKPLPKDPDGNYIPPTPTDPKQPTPVPYLPAGTVTVHYVDENGNVIQDPTVDTEKSPVGTPYNTNENDKEIPKEITGKDGKTYVLVGVDPKDKDKEIGTVEKGNIDVTYVYKLKEDTPPPTDTPQVYIPYIPQDPKNPLDPNDPHDPTIPETGEKIPEVPYDQTPEDPSDDPRLPDVPDYIPVDPSDPTKPLPKDPDGNYIPPTPTDPKQPTPVPYLPAGTVTVHYVDEKGNVLQDPTVDTEKSLVGTPYNTNENDKEIPKEITGKDGKTYILVGVDPKDKDKEIGTVKKGNIDVTYVYKLKEDTPPPTDTPQVYIPYIPQDPKNPLDPNDPHDPTIPETGEKIPEVPYDQTPEDPSDDPRLPDVPDYIPVDPSDPTKPLPKDPDGNYIPPTPTDPKQPTPVPYLPAGTVTVHYVDEKGNVLQDPTVDTEKSLVGTPYNTNENDKEIPKEITGKDGKTYILVGVKDGDSETGKVTKGNTDVTYIYKLKVTDEPTPNPDGDKPGVELPGKPGNPTPDMPGQPGKPAEPAMPNQPTKETVPTYMKKGESLPNTGDAASQSGLVYGAAALGLTALLAAMKKKSENEE
ncbi:MucBP domain-containing protein [Streptococcus pneumoniae]